MDNRGRIYHDPEGAPEEDVERLKEHFEQERERILRASGQQVTGLKKAKRDEEKVPGRGTRQLTAIERARLKKS